MNQFCPKIRVYEDLFIPFSSARLRYLNVLRVSLSYLSILNCAIKLTGDSTLESVQYLVLCLVVSNLKVLILQLPFLILCRIWISWPHDFCIGNNHHSKAQKWLKSPWRLFSGCWIWKAFHSSINSATFDDALCTASDHVLSNQESLSPWALMTVFWCSDQFGHSNCLKQYLYATNGWRSIFSSLVWHLCLKLMTILQWCYLTSYILFCISYPVLIVKLGQAVEHSLIWPLSSWSFLPDNISGPLQLILSVTQFQDMIWRATNSASLCLLLCRSAQMGKLLKQKLPMAQWQDTTGCIKRVVKRAQIVWPPFLLGLVVLATGDSLQKSVSYGHSRLLSL